MSVIPVELADCIVDLPRRTVTRDGESIPLTAREAKLLEYLFERPGRVVPREELYARVWEFADGVVSRALDFTVCRVRAKLERNTAQPVHLFTERGVGYRFEPTARREVAPVNTAPLPAIPIEATRFFGRAAELADIGRRLVERRLVTLVGPPGMGKTRLAREFATARAVDVPVWWLDLADCASDRDLLARACDVLGLHDASPDAIASALAARGPSLLVLDNAELVLGGAVDLVGILLRRAPDVRILATSRERLRARGEWCLELGPLDATAAAELFADRARAVGRAFCFEHTEHIHRLVERLDRMPLAIELCAARTNVLSVRALLERWSPLRDRRGALRAAIDESWQQLGPEERALLTRATVFRGGFSLEAAEVVFGSDDKAWLEHLAVLCDRSLVRSWEIPASGEVRFGTYTAIHEFAREHLRADDPAHRRHREYFADLGPRLDAAIATRAALAEIDQLLLERDNFQILVAQREDDAAAVAASLAYFHLALRRGVHDGIATMLEGAADRCGGLPLAVQARAHTARALLHLQHGEPHEGALSIARDLAARAGDEAWLAVVLGMSSLPAHESGDAKASRRYLDDALSLHTRHAAWRRAAHCLRGLAGMDQAEGRFEEAEARLRQALGHVRRTNDAPSLAAVLMSLGNLLASRGRHAEAEEALAEALEFARDSRELVQEGEVRRMLAWLCLDREDLAAARLHARAAVDLHRSAGLIRRVSLAQLVLGIIEACEGRLTEAAHQLEEAHLAPSPPPLACPWLVLVRLAQGRREAATALLQHPSDMRGIVGPLQATVRALCEGEEVALERLDASFVFLRASRRFIEAQGLAPVAANTR